MADDENGNDVDDRIGASRGPAYPYIDLERAVEKALAIAEKGAARQKMPPEAFYKLWGMGPKSSGSRQTMAALNYYGLVDYVGRGRDRKVQLTDLALRIVLDKRPNSTERENAIKSAALEPSIFRELHDKYAPFFPDDVVIETHLRIEKAFNDDAAKTTIKRFRDTMEFAGLDKPAHEPLFDSDKPDTDLDSSTDNGVDVQIDDIVQATVAGVDLYENGAKVIGLSDDRRWVFTDQSRAGIAIEDVSVLTKATKAAAPTPPPVPANLLSSITNKEPDLPPAPGSRRAIFPLDEGDVTLIYPENISAESLEDLSAYLAIFLKKEIKKAQKADG